MKTHLFATLVIAQLAFASPKTIPPFHLPDLKGRDHSSSELAGKIVLIDFWATWCAACKETVPQLAAIQKKYARKGLVVVGVSVDKCEREKVLRGAKKLGMTYQALHDPESRFATSFGYDGIPSVYLFGKDGKLVLAIQGYAQDREKQLTEALDKL